MDAPPILEIVWQLASALHLRLRFHICCWLILLLKRAASTTGLLSKVTIFLLLLLFTHSVCSFFSAHLRRYGSFSDSNEGHKNDCIFRSCTTAAGFWVRTIQEIGINKSVSANSYSLIGIHAPHIIRYIYFIGMFIISSSRRGNLQF